MKSITKLMCLIVFSLPFLVHAGYTQPAPVIIDLDNNIAYGDMMTARWTKGDDTFIGCGIRHYQGGFVFGFCQAQDDDGELAYCQTQDAVLLESMKSMADNSFITYSWNDDGECTRIGFSNQSFYINKDNPSFANKNKNKNP
ncbi:hypothetical protein [Aliiglaciecola litoralis]|uniref:Uncharacterized protein n=1 Tax=Aliiglaciecola litoralis TaxID=582857 RepID=A0ABN1LD41_9ALTE